MLTFAALVALICILIEPEGDGGIKVEMKLNEDEEWTRQFGFKQGWIDVDDVKHCHPFGGTCERCEDE